MRHVIVGVSGQVGGILWKFLNERGEFVVGTYMNHAVSNQVFLDMTDQAAVQTFINQYNPDVVWLPAAMPDVDRCEREPEVSFRINVDGTRNVGRAARDIGARIVFFSTDYVFNGIHGPFIENDVIDPIQVYGQHKAQAEEILLKEVPRSLVVRPAWIYSREPGPRNFVWRIVQQLKSGQAVKSLEDQYSTPTPAESLIEKAFLAVTNGVSGVMHLVGPERMSRYELTVRIAEMAGYPKDLVIPIRTESLNLPAKRPLNGGLITHWASYRITEPLDSIPAF